jgi:hypothetical protein
MVSTGVKYYTQKQYLAPAKIALRWDVDRSTVGRTMKRYGVEGLKTGLAKSASIRYDVEDVKRIEALCRPDRKIAPTKGVV